MFSFHTETLRRSLHLVDEEEEVIADLSKQQKGKLSLEAFFVCLREGNRQRHTLSGLLTFWNEENLY